MSQPKQLHLDIKLDESITLDNFISCSSTELVLKATNHFVSNHSSFKTLYLWGKDGVGKNYLLHATNKKCKENNLSSTFLSFSRNTFEDKAVLEGLEELDVIFIEGLERYPNDKDWEIALFNLVNAGMSKGVRMLFSSNQVAKDLSMQLSDLKSRLIAFPAFELPEITEKEKIEALDQSAQRKGLIFEEKVLTYILNHTSRSLEDLLKLMSDLDTFSLEKKRKVSISLVKDLLSDKEDNLST